MNSQPRPAASCRWGAAASGARSRWPTRRWVAGDSQRLPAGRPSSTSCRERTRPSTANRRILQYLSKHFHADDIALNAWCGTWISAGFDALEALLAQDKFRDAFCFDMAPTLADVYLVPQIESARRFKVDMSQWPLISEVDAACASLPAFALAAPLAQPDAASV